MRAAATMVVGLILGGVVGFALRGWFVDEPSRVDAPSVAGRASSEDAAPALPAVSRSPAEPLRPTAATPAQRSTAIDGETSVAAADALVGILVHGAVVEADGRPATLGAWNSLQFDDGVGPPDSVQVGAAATYAVSGLRPGTWTVSIDSQGYRPYSHALALSAAEPVVRLDIVLQPAVVLDVKALTPSGEPLVKALQAAMAEGNSWNARLSAIATREPPPAALPETSQRAYGRWEIGTYTDASDHLDQGEAMPADVLGRLELDESLPVYVSLLLRHLVLQTQPVEPGSTEVVFVVPESALEALLGSVRLRVVDAETRQPLIDAYANLFDSQSSGGGQPADATGAFRWERQRPGLLELSVSAPEHEKWDGEVSVPPGSTADLGTLELTPATPLRGVVRDEDGQPHSVNLRALANEPRGAGIGARRFQKSGADGRFEWKTLGRRRYTLLVSDEEWTALPVPVDLSNGGLDDVLVTVVRGVNVRLIARWPKSERYDVRVVTDDGLTVSSAESWASDRAWSRRMAPGAYAAVLSLAGRDLKQVPFTVGAQDIAVDLAP